MVEFAFLLLLFALSIFCCGDVKIDGGSAVLIRGNSMARHDTNRASSNEIRRDIIGGTKATLGSWPWQALVRYTDYTDGGTYLCGGTLISSRHILTAAHCTITMDITRTTVTLGAADVSSQSTQGLTRKVRDKREHPDYSANEHVNPAQLYDLAILTLSQDVVFSDIIRPICLPSSNFSVSDYAYVTGYGAYNQGTNIVAQPSPYLQQTAVPIIDQQLCSEKWQDDLGDYGGGFPIQDSQICAGATGHGSAQGDSGGPLVQQSSDGRWFQLGIVSFGVNQGKGYYDQALAPGVYTRISSYCSFVSSTTGGAAGCGIDNYSTTAASLISIILSIFVWLL